MMPPFHGAKVKSYAKTICHIAENVASQWQEKSTFSAHKAMQDITLETILHVVFGLSEGERCLDAHSLAPDGDIRRCIL